MNNIALITQRPIIDFSKMNEVGLKVQERLSQYDFANLVVTDKNVTEIKELRATLNKEFKLAEETRKLIKKEVNDPYTQFEEAFKENIAKHYQDADAKLKNAIDDVENAMKKQKENEVKEYFNKQLSTSEIDFITFEQMRLNVTLSASMKSLKEEVDNFIKTVLSDISLINSQEHTERIFVEYKCSLNVSQAIQKVIADVKLEKELIERKKQKEEEIKVVQEIVKEVEKTFVEEEPIITVSFTITDTKTNILKVREFMKGEGIKYE